MKARTLKKRAVILLGLILAIAAAGLTCLAVGMSGGFSSGTVSHGQILAATPEPSPAAPVKRADCPLCSEISGGGGYRNRHS